MSVERIQPELPGYLKTALVTSEVGGYKRYENVLEAIIESQTGIYRTSSDPSIIRATLEQYVKMGLIERRNKGSISYLMDLTAGHPKRLTKDQYRFYLVLKKYLDKNKFRILPYNTIKAEVKEPRNVSQWIAVLLKTGFLETDNSRARYRKFRLGPPTEAAVYDNLMFHDGVLVHLDEQELDVKFATENSYQSTLDAMAAIIADFEARLRVATHVEEMQALLRRAGKNPEQINALLGALIDECKPLKSDGPSLPSLEHELRLLQTSLPVWQKYLRK